MASGIPPWRIFSHKKNQVCTVVSLYLWFFVYEQVHDLMVGGKAMEFMLNTCDVFVFSKLWNNFGTEICISGLG